MHQFILAVQYVLVGYFALSTIHVLVLSVAARFFARIPISAPYALPLKIAILIPCYREDAVIINSVNSYNQQDYPREKFTVFLVADSLMPSTLEKLSRLNIKLLVADFEQSTVTKSIQLGMGAIDSEQYPVTLICDADNVLEKDFLTKISSVFRAGHRVVQGCRYTKNINTPMAVLDSLSEIINNHLYRKGCYALGLSSALIGSGMAFETALLKDCMAENHSLNGYDRELQLLLSERGVSIAYLETAVCYDEKISSGTAFDNQRKRWLASQFTNLRDHFTEAFTRLGKKGGLNYFQFAVIFNIFLTRLINLGLLGLMSTFYGIASLFISPATLITPWYWYGLMSFYAVALLLAVPSGFLNLRLVKAVLRIPATFFSMTLLLFRTKEARTKFMHTEHIITEVETSLPENTK